MKFQHVNVGNLRWLLPRWAGNHMQLARLADQALSKYTPAHSADPAKALLFSFVFDLDAKRLQVHEPEDGGRDFIGMFILRTRDWQIDFQINYALRSFPSIAGKHCVYSHGLVTDAPIGYIGITKREWYARLAQHESSARGGSPFLFHRALRQHPSVARRHRIYAAGLGLEQAMAMEERLVAACSLYPIGLNMIPGGSAGLRYLGSIGRHIQSSELAADAISEEMQRPSTEGRPNPLCTARWESDPDYVARVICGHSGRLSIEQVQMIRAMHVACRRPAEIAELAGAKNLRQVTRLLAGSTYSRIAQ